MFKEFKEFAVRGNVVDMAVGIIIGAAFGTVVSSFVSDVLMPPVGVLVGNIDFSNFYVILKEGKVPGPYPSLAAAKAAGAATLNLGLFINTIINFLIVAFAIFLLIRGINRLRREMESPPPAAAAITKECPYCKETIPLQAIRCGHCTSELKTA